MNPFSGFLQPPTQRSPLAGAAETVQNLTRFGMARDQEKNRVREASLDNARADQYLKLQQGQQAHQFAEQDQKKLQALLLEYQDAEDQGDSVRMSRAEQALKAFGGAEVSKKPAPLPGQLLPDLKAFRADEPMDAVVAEELATREKLRKRTEDPLLSQEDFESQLISGSGLPERMEQGGQTTESGKLAAGAGQPEDLGDVDSPEFQQAAAEEVVDLDKDSPAPLQIGALPPVEKRSEAPQAAGQTPRPLPGQLPTVISKGGKTIYESTGPSGRWQPMVESVFQPFTDHETPEIAQAAERAKAIAGKLIQVDGVAPKDAIKMGMDYLQAEANRVTNLERTKLGSRRGGLGGGGGFSALTKRQDSAESIKLYISEARSTLGTLNKSDSLLAQAEALANSPDPALQRNAIDLLVQSRSGATVSDRERARYDQLDGAISQAQNYLARWTGGTLDPSYVKKIKMVIAEQRRINRSTREETAADLEEAYMAQNEGKAEAPILERRKTALGKVIRRNEDAGADPNADLDQ